MSLNVRANKSSLLRTSRGSVPHARKHVSKIWEMEPIQARSSSSPRPARVPDPSVPKKRQDWKPQPEASFKRSTARPRSSTTEGSSMTLRSPLAAELAARDLTIRELEAKLQLSEEVASKQALGDVEILRGQLLISEHKYKRMCTRMEEADLRLAETSIKVKNYVEQTTSLEVELKHAREAIGRLQMQLDGAQAPRNELREKLKAANADLAKHSQAEAQLRQEVSRMQAENAKKDMLLSQVTSQLAARNEEFHSLFQTLREKQVKARSQEHSLKLLAEQNERSSLMRAKLEEQNATLQAQIVRLKRDLREYSEIIVGNDGEPFYEVLPAVGTSNAQKTEPEVSEEVPKPICQDVAGEPAPRQLPHRQQSDPVRPEGAQLVGRYFQPMQQLLRQQQQQSQQQQQQSQQQHQQSQQLHS